VRDVRCRKVLGKKVLAAVGMKAGRDTGVWKIVWAIDESVV
jgi:hypothetical protein